MNATTELTSLHHLALQINDAHRACEAAASTALDHAYIAGRLLTDAKMSVGHGEWLVWLVTHCAFSSRTAQVYLKLHANREIIEAKTQSTAHLSIAAALKALPSKTPRRVDDGDAIRRLLPERGQRITLIPPGVAKFDIARTARIVPHTQPGFYFVSIFAPDCMDQITVIGNKRGFRPEDIEGFLRDHHEEVRVDYFDPSIDVLVGLEEPWSYHELLFNSHRS